MAFLLTSGDKLVVCAGNLARVFRHAELETGPAGDSAGGTGTQANAGFSLVARIDCGHNDSNRQSEQNGDKATDENLSEIVKDGDQSEVTEAWSIIPGQILAAAIANDPGGSDGSILLAIADDFKRLRIWSIEKEGDTLEILSTILIRRATALTFTPCRSSLLVADKNGDAWTVKVKQQQLSPTKILGHMGMLLDIKSSPDGRFVLTCDRDEKIRASHFPNAYNIHHFYLGHAQFVYCLETLPFSYGADFVSGGGDAFILFWNLNDPNPVASINVEEVLRSNSPPIPVQIKSLTAFGCNLVAAFNELPVILIYELESQSDDKRNGSIKVELKQMLTMDANVWDCKFTSAGSLAILIAPETSCVQFYHYANGVFVKDDSISIELEREFIDPALKVPSLFSILERSKIDNMKTYLETKERRLAGNDKAVRWGGVKKRSKQNGLEIHEEKKLKTDACD